MNEKNQNKIIAKIRKLFALANDKGSMGAESETAMRMANRMLEKHSLEMHQLADNDDVFCTFADYNLKEPGAKTIIGAVCRLYNCRVIFDYNWSPVKTLIIGTGANRVTAVIVIDQLLDQVKSECRGKGAAFKNGAAIGLNDVCCKIINERKACKVEIIPGTGLMPLDQIQRQALEVNDFVEKNFSDLKKSKAGKGSAAGYKYGQGLNPGARVTGESQRMLT